MLCQADYAEERLDAHEEFEEELNQALYIRKMIDTGMHDRALERLMASTEARKRTRPTRLTDVAPSIFFFVDHQISHNSIFYERTKTAFVCHRQTKTSEEVDAMISAELRVTTNC